MKSGWIFWCFLFSNIANIKNETPKITKNINNIVTEFSKKLKQYLRLLIFNTIKLIIKNLILALTLINDPLSVISVAFNSINLKKYLTPIT